MITEKTLNKFGYAKDANNVYFNKVFKNNTKLNELYIDVYNENPINHSSPLMLLLRTHDKNVLIKNEDDRFIVEKNDKFNTKIINILSSKIEVFYNESSNYYVDFLLNVCNVWYKISIFI